MKDSCRIGAVIASRLSSSRLPGKAMLSLGQYTVLELLFLRLSRSALLDKIILATSNESSDDLLENVAAAHGVPVYRGALDDVVDRYAGAAKAFNLDVIVRLTGDNPFISGLYVDDYIEQIGGAVDTVYTTRPHCPKGMNVEFFSDEMLYWLNSQDDLSAYHREHLTSWFYSDESKWKPVFLRGGGIFAEKGISFSIDTLDEYVVASKVSTILGDAIVDTDVATISRLYEKVLSDCAL